MVAACVRPVCVSKEEEAMGLNLETLIGILVILILLILADGLRRMFRERQGRLRMRIDPRYRDAPEEEDAEAILRRSF